MNIGIYIGSFNPVHLVHEEIVKDLANDEVNKVIIIPTGDDYHLKNNLAGYKHRYNMLKLAFDSEYVDVCDLEKDKYHFTYQNIAALKQIYINDNLFLIIGADNLIELNTWKNYKYLLENCYFIVYGRNNIDIEYFINNNFTNYKNKFIIKKQIKDISSTLIRKKILINENIEKYLNKKVLNYIKQNKLYGVK